MPVSSKVRTCLWFDSEGEAAAQLYVSLIPGSSIDSVFRPEPGKPPIMVNFTLAGVPYQILNGGPGHPQTTAASISVQTDDQAETDKIWDALVANCGSPVQCGWLKDRFGLSWQIVPRRLPELLGDPDRAKSARAMQAMMKMVKIDIAALEAAARAEV